MYKILNTKALGVSGRQNELIELALTHKFQGVEVDMVDLVGRHDTLGKEFACQFLQSARIDVGTFKLPIEFGAPEAEFKKAIEGIPTILDLAQTLGAQRCYVEIEQINKDTAFQENFESHRSRLFEMAEKFKEHDVKIGLALTPGTPSAEDGFKFIQTAEELLTLVKTVGNDNVGLCLDTWLWAVHGGAMDQLGDTQPATIFEVRMADLSADADPGSIKSGDRDLPGDGADSLSVKILNHLIDAGYEGPISIAADSAFFGRYNREQVVAGFSKRLDQLAAKEDLTAPSEEEIAAAAAAAEAEGGEAATDAKADDAKPGDAKEPVTAGGKTT